MSGQGLGRGTSSPATVTAKRSRDAGGVQHQVQERPLRVATRPRSGSRRRAARRPARRRRGAARRRAAASSMTSACSSSIRSSPWPGWSSMTSSLPAAIECDEPIRSRLCVGGERRAVVGEQRRLGPGPGLFGVEQQAVVVEHDGGGDLRGQATSRWRGTATARRLAPQEPDRRPLRQLEAVDDREAVAAVEGEVAAPCRSPGRRAGARGRRGPGRRGSAAEPTPWPWRAGSTPRTAR